MKVNLDEIHSNRFKGQALVGVNLGVRDVRRTMMRDLPRLTVRRIVNKINEARREIMTQLGVEIPTDMPISSRLHRRIFMATLSIDIKIQIYKGVAQRAKAIMLEEGLPHLAELEDMRLTQLNGVDLSVTKEDVRAVSQICSSTASNMLNKYKATRNENPGLSSGAVSWSSSSPPAGGQSPT